MTPSLSNARYMCLRLTTIDSQPLHSAKLTSNPTYPQGPDGTPNDDVITPASQMYVESGRTNHKPGKEPDPSYQSKAHAASLASFETSLTKQW